jgi:hypothetical protein
MDPEEPKVSHLWLFRIHSISYTISYIIMDTVISDLIGCWLDRNPSCNRFSNVNLPQFVGFTFLHFGALWQHFQERTFRIFEPRLLGSFYYKTSLMEACSVESNRCFVLCKLCLASHTHFFFCFYIQRSPTL